MIRRRHIRGFLFKQNRFVPIADAAQSNTATVIGILLVLAAIAGLVAIPVFAGNEREAVTSTCPQLSAKECPATATDGDAGRCPYLSRCPALRDLPPPTSSGQPVDRDERSTYSI